VVRIRSILESIGEVVVADGFIGDLGIDPRDVEDRLQEVFRLAQAWDCILLLDEADIFLAQRTVTDVHRNALVSGKGHLPHLE
jgi:hypothetical protein